MNRKRPADVDVRQSIKDIFLTPSRYKMDCSYVLKGGTARNCSVSAYLCLVRNGDEVAPPKSSRMLASALEKAGVPVQLNVFCGVGHGVGPSTGTSAEGWVGKAVEFWKIQL